MPGMPQPGAERRRALLTWGGLAVYVALSIAAFARWHLLTSRDWLWVWMLLGLLAVSLADLRGWVRGILRDWLPFMAMILAYDLLRGISDGLVATAHSLPGIDFDHLLFAGHLPTVELQRRFYDVYHPHWYDYVTWAVYSTHFLVTVIVAAVLWRTARERFRRFRNRVVALAFAGIATFAVFPTVPPWLAAREGLIPHIRRVALHTAHHLGVREVGAIFEHGRHFANVVAAVPSLHAAFPMLLLLFFWPTSGRALRALLIAYVLAMGLAVVYSGEHYVFDVLVGWAYAGGVIAGFQAAAGLRARWRAGGFRTLPRPLPRALAQLTAAAASLRPRPTGRAHRS